MQFWSQCGKKPVQYFKKKRRSYLFLIGSLSVIFWDFRTEVGWWLVSFFFLFSLLLLSSSFFKWFSCSSLLAAAQTNITLLCRVIGCQLTLLSLFFAPFFCICNLAQMSNNSKADSDLILINVFWWQKTHKRLTHTIDRQHNYSMMSLTWTHIINFPFRT